MNLDEEFFLEKYASVHWLLFQEIPTSSRLEVLPRLPM
jgi:hypothetical protein